MIVIDSYAVSDEPAVMIVPKATPTASRAVMHPRKLEYLTFLAVAELGSASHFATIWI